MVSYPALSGWLDLFSLSLLPSLLTLQRPCRLLKTCNLHSPTSIALYRHLQSTVASLPLDPEIAGNVFGGRASRLKSIFTRIPSRMESF